MSPPRTPSRLASFSGLPSSPVGPVIDMFSRSISDGWNFAAPALSACEFRSTSIGFGVDGSPSTSTFALLAIPVRKTSSRSYRGGAGGSMP
jgi:hypothetical protein